jgi:hypothetical protein
MEFDHHGRPLRDPNSNADPHPNLNPIRITDIDTDTDTFRKHIRHCPLLLESSSRPGAKCDAHPNWDVVGLNIVRRLR